MKYAYACAKATVTICDLSTLRIHFVESRVKCHFYIGQVTVQIFHLQHWVFTTNTSPTLICLHTKKIILILVDWLNELQIKITSEMLCLLFFSSSKFSSYQSRFSLLRHALHLYITASLLILFCFCIQIVCESIQFNKVPDNSPVNKV